MQHATRKTETTTFSQMLAEFPRSVLEVLRQPMEQGTIAVSRVRERVELPARFVLMAAMNPCPCGFLDSDIRECSCVGTQIRRYRAKLSGPLLDRLDLMVPVRALTPDEILGRRPGEASEIIRRRVVSARLRQRERLQERAGVPFGGPRGLTNGTMRAVTTEEVCRLEGETKKLAQSVVHRMKLSARGYHRLLRVARTIADLEGSDRIELPMLQEAVQFRFTGFSGET